jgi:hypothetical protein
MSEEHREAAENRIVEEAREQLDLAAEKKDADSDAWR